VNNPRRLPDGRHYAGMTTEERARFIRHRLEELRDRRMQLALALGRRRPDDIEEVGRAN
jgi:hypothetical protein